MSVVLDFGTVPPPDMLGPHFVCVCVCGGGFVGVLVVLDYGTVPPSDCLRPQLVCVRMGHCV